MFSVTPLEYNGQHLHPVPNLLALLGSVTSRNELPYLEAWAYFVRHFTVTGQLPSRCLFPYFL